MTKEELEQEAEKRAKDYTENKVRQVDYECGFLDGADVFKKENAELKEINEGYCRNRDRLISIGFPNFKDCKEYADQFNKAKEIIRDLLSCLYSVEYDCVSDLEEAEQFLNEVEK